MEKMLKNCLTAPRRMANTRRALGITLLPQAAAALFAALLPVLAGCLNPLASPPPAAKAAAGAAAAAAEAPDAASGSAQREPYTAAVYLGGDGAEEDAARSIAGSTKERINLNGIRNYVQVIAVDKADGTVAGVYEERGSGAGPAALTLRGLVSGRTYGILLLQGHWERDYAAETPGGAYVYKDNPPALLSAGYKEVTFSGGGSAAIAVWPIYVDMAFTTGAPAAADPGGIETPPDTWAAGWPAASRPAPQNAGAGGLTVEPAVTGGKPGAVNLPAGAWTVNWKVLRGASGTASGLGDLITAQKATGFPGESLIVTGKKAVVWTAAPNAAASPNAAGAPGAAGALSAETPGALTLTGHTVTLPLADYTGLSQAGKAGAVNFALNFIPFNATKGWAKYDASSVFDLASGPPQWVIRNGLNDRPQDDRTDFEKFGAAPVTEANGNGAVRFTVANPLSAAAGELVVSDGSYSDSAITFTASGFTGTAQAWYAAVPAAGAAAAAACLPLGDIPAGTHTKPVTFPGKNPADYDIFVLLLKDGKAGAMLRISVSPSFPLTSVAAARNYLASLAAAGDSRGSKVTEPVQLPMAVNLSGADSLANLLAAIAEKGKYVDLDLSRCTMSGTEFNPNPASNTGKNRVVSLVLPNTAASIKDTSETNSSDYNNNNAFRHFTVLKTVSGSGVTAIGGAAFRFISTLALAAFPNALTIKHRAFEGTALAQANFPRAATVGLAAFYNCTALSQLTLTAAKTIGDSVFYGCTALTGASLPAATSIGDYAFQNCAALTGVSLPAAASIGANAFLSTGTKALTVTLPANAPPLGAGSTASGGYSKTVTVNRPAENGGYDEAWQAAFKKLFGGGANITLNGNPKFFSFPLTSVAAARDYLGAAVKNTAAAPVSLPMKVNLSNSSPDSLSNLLAVIAEKGKYVALDLSRCTSNNNVFDPNPAINTGKDMVVSLVLPDAAWGIPDDPGYNPAFNYFTNLKSVSGKGITYVGSFAFVNRTSLKEANFPNAADTGPYVFHNCTSLVSADFPGVTVIRTGVFWNCTSLTQVNMPAAQDIQDHAFQNTASLKTVNFPGADWIRDYAFQDSGLTVADFPRVSYIGYYAFWGSKSLVEAHFANGRILHDYAFSGCTSLKRAYFPWVDNGRLGRCAFEFCTSLEYVDLSWYEPLEWTTAVFFETGPTPITIVLNALERSFFGTLIETAMNGGPRDSEIPGSVSYSKHVEIKIDMKGGGGTDGYELSAWNRVFRGWFGSGANLSFSGDIHRRK